MAKSRLRSVSAQLGCATDSGKTTAACEFPHMTDKLALDGPLAWSANSLCLYAVA